MKASDYGKGALGAAALSAAALSAMVLAKRRRRRFKGSKRARNEEYNNMVTMPTVLVKFPFNLEGLATVYRAVSNHDIPKSQDEDELAFVCMFMLHVSSAKFETIADAGFVLVVRDVYSTVPIVNKRVDLSKETVELLRNLRRGPFQETRYDDLSLKVRKAFHNAPTGTLMLYRDIKTAVTIQCVKTKIIDMPEIMDIQKKSMWFY